MEQRGDTRPGFVRGGRDDRYGGRRDPRHHVGMDDHGMADTRRHDELQIILERRRLGSIGRVGRVRKPLRIPGK